MNETPLAELRSAETPPRPVDEDGRSAQRFRVEVVVRRGDAERRAAASRQDIYAVTGPMVERAVARLLAPGAQPRRALPAGQLFDARQLLRSLTPGHLALELAP